MGITWDCPRQNGTRGLPIYEAQSQKPLETYTLSPHKEYEVQSIIHTFDKGKHCPGHYYLQPLSLGASLQVHPLHEAKSKYPNIKRL